jgi:hypothetical protein
MTSSVDTAELPRTRRVAHGPTAPLTPAAVAPAAGTSAGPAHPAEATAPLARGELRAERRAARRARRLWATAGLGAMAAAFGATIVVLDVVR